MNTNEKKEITIRIAKEEDAEELLAIYAPYIEHTVITYEYDVPTVEEFRGRIRHVLERYPYLVAEVNGEICGYAYASAFHERPAGGWNVETSIYVDQNKKGMGIGTKLYDMLEKILKRQNVLNMNACIACTEHEDEYLTNASIHYHEHLGYRMVGYRPLRSCCTRRLYPVCQTYGKVQSGMDGKRDWRTCGRSAAGDRVHGYSRRYFFTERRTPFIICMLK